MINTASPSLLLLVFCLFASCSKKSSTPDNTNSGCRLITVTEDISNKTDVFNLDYDDKGRIVKITDVGANPGSRELTYAGDSIFVKRFVKSILKETDTVLLNSNGLATKFLAPFSNTAQLHLTFTYSGTECIKLDVTVTDAGSTADWLFSWANGNPTTSIVTPTGGSSTTFFYTHNDKPEQRGGYDMVTQLLSGYTYLRPANMLTLDSSDAGVFHMAYTFDANGNVSLIQRVEDPFPLSAADTYTLQWQCK